MNREELIEALASSEHERWSRWMIYLFLKSKRQSDGTVIIPEGLVDRWQTQINTPYEHLSDVEQESDRKEARRTIAIMEKFL